MPADKEKKPGTTVGPVLEQRRKRCTGVHWFANELIKAIVLLKINELSTKHTSGHTKMQSTQLKSFFCTMDDME